MADIYDHIGEDLGKSTSYAYYVAEGGTKTPKEYGEMLVNIDTVATRAEEAAGQAAESASSAEQSKNSANASASAAAASQLASAESATRAENKAGEAEQSAGTASEKAQATSIDAETARRMAEQAAASAGTAAGHAANAESSADAAAQSKADAETAKTDAETAKDGAVSAKGDAEQAKADAQAIVDGIQAESDQIDQNTADLLKAFPTDTASGAVASFSDGANVPVKSLIVNIDPVQSGSGDPSPTNVRPISGWSEVNVNACGANVLDESSFTQYGAVKQSDGSWFATNLYPFFNQVAYAPPTGYTGQLAVTFKRKTESGKQSLRLIINYTDGTNVTLGFSNATGNWDTYTLVTNGSKTVANIKYDYGNGVDTYFNLLVAFATTATPYEPYSGQSINIALGQTVYGGKLDVLSGELVIDLAMVDLGTLSWTYVSNANYPRFITNIVGAVGAKDDNSLANIICSVYSNATVNNIYRGDKDKVLALASTASLWVRDTSYTDATAFKAAVTGQTLVYELATPLTITLTPNELSTLLGANNIWSDAGEVTAEYRADPTLFIQKKIAEAISALS